jgi:hypothetical protein
MTTVLEIVLQEQVLRLREIAENRGWFFELKSNDSFVIGFPARDRSMFWLRVDCDGFPGLPPAWHWYNVQTQQIDQPTDTAIGQGFLHGSGRICAPWNRLAYKNVDPAGPHSDWTLANWMTNPYTRECRTLAAMALRVFVELQSERFQTRMGART